MPLSKRVHVARRFQKSIRIDSDFGSSSALEGFVCPQSSANTLATMAQHVSQAGQGAFTWTGPYGSGKSSLAVALAALLSSGPRSQKKITGIFGQKLTKNVREALPTGSKGWRVLPVVARRDDPIAVIGEAIDQAGLVSRRPRNGWNEDNLIGTLLKVAAEQPKTHGGLLLFIDEMGKFLEAAARDGSDIYVLQQLAEAASRSKGRLLVVGVLHQAFEEYAHRLSRELRDEWAKIQGRFVDLAVNPAGDEQIDLISRAISSTPSSNKLLPLARTVAGFVQRNKSADNIARLASTLEACWPLHPIVACLLGPVSRRRFGQNQRSIFGFLNSSEPNGFQDFLNQAADDELYTPDRLWDYLRTNLEPSIMASPDGHRWALAAESLERCEAIGGDELHVKLLKTIAVVDLFKERSGVTASSDVLHTCFPSVSKKVLEGALAQLDKWSITIFKKFLGARSIFSGSDFDIELATRTSLEAIDSIDFNDLKSLAGVTPILAKRHYYETGSLRWFEVNVVPVNEIIEFASSFKLEMGAIGQFVLAVPTEGESEATVDKACRDAAKNGNEEIGDIIIGISQHSWTIMPVVRELYALEKVRNEHPELAGDPVARREVSIRIAATQGSLESELHKAFSNAKWFMKGHKKKTLRQKDLNILASDLADKRFSMSPRIHNELLNRQNPSASAISAQNKLLHLMVSNQGEPRLGIQGYPAEGGLFASTLKETNLYMRKGKSWQFDLPNKEEQDTARLGPLWQATIDYIKRQKSSTVPVSDIFDLWRQPPFGVKRGIMPILIVAFMLAKQEKLAIYRDGVFRANFDDVDTDYLAKSPSAIQLRWMDLSEVSRKLLSSMAQVVRALDETNQLNNLAPVDVGRGLIAIYDRLPKWVTRTTRLSTNAINVREIFKKAYDPNQFLFDDIPGLLGSDAGPMSKANLDIVESRVHEGLKELVDAYPSLLHRLQELMLTELQVPNLSSQSLAELQERATNIKQMSGDFRLDAFIGRLTQFDGSDESFESIASLAINKPPRGWTDADIDQAVVELADMARNFIRVETYAHVKGRQNKRQAMAVVIGMDGRRKPVLGEFDIADSDRPAVDKLIQRLSNELDNADSSHRNVILAALAELISQHLGKDKSPKSNQHANKRSA